MQKGSDSYEENIEFKISNILGGKTLIEWCRDIGNIFLETTKQTSPPFAVIPFLPYRRIEAVHDHSLVITAKIERTLHGFLLKINPSKFASGKYYNFVLAHEIAHTFFYDMSTPQPTEISGFTPTSSHLEYLCNKIARYIVIPEKPLTNEINNIPSIYSPKFNLYYISELIKKFQTNQFTLLTRLIVDEPILNAIFVQFELNQDNKIWELKAVFYPRYLNSSKFFIPNPSKQLKFKNLEKRPTAKKILSSFLEKTHNELKHHKRFYKLVNIKSFIGAPLHSIVKDTEYDGEIGMHFSLYERINMSEKINIINILIPINNKIIGHELYYI